MKNQLDIIISAVCIVLALIIAGVLYSQKPTVAKPEDPPKPNLAPVKAPDPQVKWSNSLPAGAGGGGFKAAPGPGQRPS